MRETSNGCLLRPTQPMETVATAKNGTAALVRMAQDGITQVRQGCLLGNADACTLPADPGQTMQVGIDGAETLVEWGFFLGEQGEHLVDGYLATAAQAEAIAWNLADWGTFLGRGAQRLAHEEAENLGPVGTFTVAMATDTPLNLAEGSVRTGKWASGFADGQSQSIQDGLAAFARDGAQATWTLAEWGAFQTSQGYGTAMGLYGSNLDYPLDVAHGSLAKLDPTNPYPSWTAPDGAPLRTETETYHVTDMADYSCTSGGQHGGCFEILGANGTVLITLDDASGQPVPAVYTFTTPDAYKGGGILCGSRALAIPDGATDLEVNAFVGSDAGQILNCPGIATTGTVTASFYARQP